MASLNKKDVTEVRALIIASILSTDVSTHITFLNAAQKSAGGWSRKTAVSMIVSAADISNAVKPFEIMKKWSNLIQEEFYMQGDREASLGFSSGPQYRRGATDLPTNVINFIDFVVTPVYTTFAKMFDNCGLEVLIDQLLINREKWVMERGGGEGKTSTAQGDPEQKTASGDNGEAITVAETKTAEIQHGARVRKKVQDLGDTIADGGALARSRSRSPRSRSRSPRKERARRKRKKESDRRKVLLAYGSPKQKVAGGVGVGVGKRPLGPLSPKAPTSARAMGAGNGASPRVGVASIKGGKGKAVAFKVEEAKVAPGEEEKQKDPKAKGKTVLDLSSDPRLGVKQVESPVTSRASSPEPGAEEKKTIGAPIHIGGKASPTVSTKRLGALTQEDVDERAKAKMHGSWRKVRRASRMITHLQNLQSHLDNQAQLNSVVQRLATGVLGEKDFADEFEALDKKQHRSWLQTVAKRIKESGQIEMMLSQIVGIGLDLDKIKKNCSESLKEIIACDFAFTCLDADDMGAKLIQKVPGIREVALQCVKTQETQIVSNVAQFLERTDSNRELVPKEKKSRSDVLRRASSGSQNIVLCAPLLGDQGTEAIGIVGCIRVGMRRGTFTRADSNLIGLVSQRMGSVVRDAIRHGKLVSLQRENDIMLRSARAMIRDLRDGTAVNDIMISLATHVKAERYRLYLLDTGNEKTFVVSSSSSTSLTATASGNNVRGMLSGSHSSVDDAAKEADAEDGRKIKRHVRADQGLAGEVLRTGQCLNVAVCVA